MNTENFFAELVGRGGVPRDRWDRALLIPAGGTIRVPYTPASGLSKYVKNDFAIQRWRERNLARGIGMSPDLAALAAAETYTTGFDEPDSGPDRESGRRLDDIVQRALDRVRTNERADWGTAVHLLTEPGSRGVPATPAMGADVASFPRKLADEGIEILGTEVFVANDHVMAAGTFDHAVRLRDGRIVVLDKKAGRRKNRLEFMIQLAVYANAQVYDRKTNERWDMGVDLEMALIAHIPPNEGRTDLYAVDIAKGWRYAQMAAEIRDEAQDHSSLTPYSS